MKFLTVALLSFLASAVDAAPKRRLDTQKLLRSAIPVNKDGSVRKLEDKEENAAQALTAAHSIQFNQCLSMKIEPANGDVAFGEDYIGYTKAGQIVPQKSYVLFNVCETEYCVYHGDDNLYMVDVDSYMGALVEYLPKKQEDYCEACREAQDVCVVDDNAQEEQQQDGQEDQQQDEQQDQQEEEQQQDEQQDQEEEQQQDEGGERRLQNQYQYQIAVDCDTCLAKGCYEDNDEDNDGQDDDMEIANWAAELAGCQATEYMFDENTYMYAGFMCNQAGNGVEIGIFLDEDCETYTSLRSYKKLMAGSEQESYLYKSQEIVTYPFLNDISCAPVNYFYDDGQQQEDDNQNGENNIAEVCQNLLQNNDNDVIYNVNDCNFDGEEDEQDEEEAQENQDEDQDENYQWYSYLVSQDDLENEQNVCMIVQALEGEYSNLHTYNGSEESGSGQIYDYSARKSGLSGGGIFGIILLVLVVVGAIVYIAASSAKKKDSKKQPLVGRNNGAMA